jgi:hypothetical protein
MKPELETYRKLARLLINTRPEEMTCDEWLEHVGHYVDIVRAGCPVPECLEEVHRHMEMCPECAEEFKAILAALCDSD